MLSAIVTQIRVVVALTLRETRLAFGTSYSGYFWAIFQPIISVSFLFFIFYLIGRKAPFGESLPLFFSTAILTLDVFNKTTASLMRAFTSNKALLSYPMIKETDTLLARLTLIAATYLIIYTIFFGVLIATGFASLPPHPDHVLEAFFATLLVGFGVGSIYAVVYTLYPNFQHIEKVIGRPLFFLSGVFYIPSRMPPEAVAVLKWNPILHLVEWLRTGFYQDYPADMLNHSFPLAFGAITLAIGLGLERVTRKQRSGL